jgi:hypothetical protein
MTQKINPARFLIVLIGIIVACGCLYAVAWFVIARQIDQQVTYLWLNTISGGVQITGEKPRTTGFPEAPRLIFSGSTQDLRGVKWDVPEMICEGFPFPGRPITFSFPKGFTLSGPMIQKPISVDHATLILGIPDKIPASISETSIRAWQQSGANIPVHQILMKSPEAAMSGDGHLELDENLQLSGEFSLKIAGLDTLLVTLSESGRISPDRARVMMGLLNALSRKDETTGISYFPTVVMFQKGGVFLGPVRVTSLPRLIWSDAGLTLGPPQ